MCPGLLAGVRQLVQMGLSQGGGRGRLGLLNSYSTLRDHPVVRAPGVPLLRACAGVAAVPLCLPTHILFVGFILTQV